MGVPRTLRYRVIRLAVLAAALAILTWGILEFAPEPRAANERNASAALKTLTSAQANFRANDRDMNGVHDFWTGDVASLYYLEVDGQPIRLISKEVADADASLPNPVPYQGYLFRVLERDDSESDPKNRDYRHDTGGSRPMGKVHHDSKFGFVAYPARPGRDGNLVYIVNENNTIFRLPAAEGPRRTWPSDEELKARMPPARYSPDCCRD
jgi:hypothetical protein